MATNSSSSAGAAGCPCVDETATLASLVERSCQTPDGSEGVLLTAEGPCVLPSYGSQYCLQHDLIHDPDCSLGGGNNIIPSYCTKPWCYVDAETCTRASDERIYRSTYFPREDGVDVVSLCVCVATTCCNSLSLQVSISLMLVAPYPLHTLAGSPVLVLHRVRSILRRLGEGPTAANAGGHHVDGR